MGSTIAQFEAPPRKKTLPVMPLGTRGGEPRGRPAPAAGSYGDGPGAVRVSGGKNGRPNHWGRSDRRPAARRQPGGDC